MAKELTNKISEGIKARKAAADAKIAAVVSGKTGVKIPIEKMSEAKADVYKRAGIVGEGSSPTRTPKQSTFNRPLRKAKPTGGAQTDKTVGSYRDRQEGESDTQHKARVIHGSIDATWGRSAPAAAQLSATTPVSGAREKKTYTAKAQLAIRHAGAFVSGAGRKSGEMETHRQTVHSLIGGMNNNEKLSLAGSEVPCSSAGCTRSHTVKGNDVVQGNLSCGSRGQNCNIPSSPSPARRPVSLTEEAGANKRLNPQGTKTVPRQ